MWYIIIAIISGAAGAFLMGLVAGAKHTEEVNKAYFRGINKGIEIERNRDELARDGFIEV